MKRECLLITDERMIDHEVEPVNPERPQRLRRLIDRFRAVEGLPIAWMEPECATPQAVERVHTKKHIDLMESLRGESTRIDFDTSVSPKSVDAAYLAAGASIAAVDAVMADAEVLPFALVRPPGHHAESGRAMGFCLLNNIAIAAQHAIDAHEVKRIMIIDWDVHHGNGTQEIFWSRDDVLYASIHQSPCYPGTGDVNEIGRGAGEGFTVNIPLPPGCGDAAWTRAFESILQPIGFEYEPELVLISAGYDAHADDPLAGMMVTERGFAAMMRMAMEIAERFAGGRIALFLEGGYDLGALVRSAEACVRAAVLQENSRDSFEFEDESERELLEMMRLRHSRCWESARRPD